jgi:hypothetical protein
MWATRPKEGLNGPPEGELDYDFALPLKIYMHQSSRILHT